MPSSHLSPLPRRGRGGRLLAWMAASLILLPPLAAAAALAGALLTRSLPPVPHPPENPPTEAKRILGKILFWDEQLSSDNSTSCGTCHMFSAGGSDPRRGHHPGLDGILGTADDVFGSPGVIQCDAGNAFLPHPDFGLDPQVMARTATTVINSAFAPELFWDGRARGQFIDPQTGEVAIATGGALEIVAVQPPVSGVEMAHADRDWDQIAAKLATARPLALAADLPPDVAAAIQSHDTYPRLFAEAFGDGAITARRVAFALAVYQRTLIADQTPWDHFRAGDQDALSELAFLGTFAFHQFRCERCHFQPLFTTPTFRNVGVRPPEEDPGRQLVTALSSDRGRFKVPTLRNAGLRSSFMHNGQFTSVADVIDFYAQVPGAPTQFQDNLDPFFPLPPLQLNHRLSLQALISEGLVDPRVAAETFPFDRPTLASQRPEALPQVVAPGVAGAGGITPRMIAPSPAAVGDLAFKVGLDAARPLASAYLAVSTTAPVAGRVIPTQIVGPLTTGSGPDAQGFATARWPIAANSALHGREVYMQWVIADPEAPGGEALSPVLHMTLFCGGTGCPPCPADWNRDTVVNSTDIAAFITHWLADLGSGGFNTDMSGDGAVNSADISVFITTWLAAAVGGC